MDAPVLVAGVVFVTFIVLILLFVRSLSASKQPQPTSNEGEVRRQPVARRIIGGGGVRRRQRRFDTRDDLIEQRDDDGSGEEEETDEEKDDLTVLRETGKIGTKKLRKLEGKAEKRVQREAAEIERQERKAREKTKEEDRKKQELTKQLEDAEKAAKEDELRQEKKRQDEEEYQRLKEAFTVDEEGTQALEVGEAQNLLQEFINHVKTSKVIMLEDLAAKFHIKTQEAIDRVKTLQSEGILTGVIDDRGKFIYITQDEYDAVAKFIKQRGRVSITELSESVNQLICLDTTLNNNNQ